VSNQVEIIYSSSRNSKETGEIIRISPRKNARGIRPLRARVRQRNIWARVRQRKKNVGERVRQRKYMGESSPDNMWARVRQKKKKNVKRKYVGERVRQIKNG
jgi:hypothetical protein